MTGTFCFLWTLQPSVPPRPWLHCPGCGQPRPFTSSGRIRLNANGRLLDAWLIYKCADCARTWNRPLFERQPRRALHPSVIDACEVSDPAFVADAAQDITALRRFSARIETDGRQQVMKQMLGRRQGHGCEACIRIIGAGAAPFRPDRLLAQELGLSRSRIDALVEVGAVQMIGRDRRAFRRAVSGEISVRIDLSDRPDTDRSRLLAAAGAQTG